MDNFNLEQAINLLKATQQLLQTQEDSPYVLNLLTEPYKDEYDIECDGSYLLEEINEFLEEL